MSRATGTTVRRAIGLASVVAGALVMSLALASCTGEPSGPAGPSPATTHEAVPTVSPTPTVTAPPTLMPDGTAGDNLAYFDHVNRQVLVADPDAPGPAFIDALTEAGFDREAMEVTRDETSVGLDADSIQFSVRFNGECLIGQSGASSGGYHSMVAPLLGTGKCLVGDTRPIDW